MRRYTLTAPDGERRAEFASELNEQQRQAALAGDGAVLIIAGAGSGKTRTLTFRVLYLLDSGVPPSAIALCTFTNKAAREMLQRVAGYEPAKGRQVWGGTFHHLANRILREHAQLLGYQDGYSILDATDAGDLLGACLQERESRHGGEKVLPRPAVLGSLISLAVNSLTPLDQVIPAQAPALVKVMDDLLPVARDYAERKRRMNAMDFDDLLWNLYTLLEQHPREAEQIAGRFLHVLVDEYQDTNRLQAELVDRLAAAHGNLTVVGDDAQSIYAFRGATPENMLNFGERWPGARTYKLEKNYRSTPPILHAANLCIANNRKQLEKVLQPVRQGEQKPVEVVVRDTAMEAAFVAQRIAELHAEGTGLDDMAVLYRAHSHSLELQLELTRRQIPYRVRSGLRFFEQAHIKDVLAYLRIVHNQRDELSWSRLLRLQPGIGVRSARTIIDRLFTTPAPLQQLLQQPAERLVSGRARSGLSSLRQQLQRLREQERQPPAQLVRLVIESGYRQLLDNLYPNPQERREDLEQLALYAEHFQDLQGFLSELHLLEAVGTETVLAARQRQEQLLLSTVHQAKGLEWPVVFVIGLVEGAFPHSWSLAEEGGLEEERRLFYVALTRARDELYLCSPLVSERGSRCLVRKTSRFLREIEPACERWLVEQQLPEPQ